MSEKASDLPEPDVVARSQSLLVAASLRFPRKIPNLFDRIFATVEMLKRAGYGFRHIEASNVLFLRQDAVHGLKVA